MTGAFYSCTSLTEVTIPDGVTNIEGFAFTNTPWLIAKQEENPLVIINGTLIDGTTCTGSVTIPDSVTSIAGGAFDSCTGLTAITIPESVTSIGDSAFYRCTGLTEIAIPESVTSIGNYAFDSCTNLTKITIPDSITSISNYAFRGCTGLKTNYYSGKCDNCWRKCVFRLYWSDGNHHSRQRNEYWRSCF